jgi:hypothetical protein
MFKYIADTQTAAMRAGNDDITSFFSPSKFQLCWRYMQFLKCTFVADIWLGIQIQSDSQINPAF